LPLLVESRALETIVHTAEEWSAIRPVWEQLVENCPAATFFLTCEWVDAWLETFAESLAPQILVFRDKTTPVGACLLVRRKHYYGFVPVDRIHLNTAGEDPEDSPWIEFNNLLCLDGREQEVASALCAHVSALQPDEVLFDGFCSGPALEALRSTFSCLRHASDVRVNYYVQLDALRARKATYESALGQKTRYRLRQNYKMYGDIAVEAAASTQEAHLMLDELAALNHKVWEMRGIRTAFESERFLTFHRTLIERAFSTGAIQMLRFTAEGVRIGYMYNFVHRGKVYFYQSGLVYSENKRVRPGFVCIGKAVAYCLEQPELSEFHLMPGGDHYKESMGTNSQPIEWVLAQQTNARIRAVDVLRSIKRKIRPVSKPAAAVAASEE
jgi:CelD/BcsL family acetyltransferase involved in cellulose biosynthesis